jgi:hypothetical protein
MKTPTFIGRIQGTVFAPCSHRHDTGIHKVELFPLSLSERVEQWYTDTIKSVNGDLGKLRDNSCNSFSLL